MAPRCNFSAPPALTPAEQTAANLRAAAFAVEQGAAFGYMAGPRLDAYRRIEAIEEDLRWARHYRAPDLEERTAQALAEAGSIADTWRERWE